MWPPVLYRANLGKYIANINQTIAPSLNLFRGRVSLPRIYLTRLPNGCFVIPLLRWFAVLWWLAVEKELKIRRLVRRIRFFFEICQQCCEVSR